MYDLKLEKERVRKERLDWYVSTILFALTLVTLTLAEFYGRLP